MSRLVILPQAQQDLFEIGNYVKSFDPAAARRLLTGLRTGLLHIAAHPGIGRARPDLDMNLRYFPIGVHLIFYRTGGGVTEIIRIVDGRRDGRGLFA